jgi:hypothetical protein
MLRKIPWFTLVPVLGLSACAPFSAYDIKDDVVPLIFNRLRCELYEAREAATDESILYHSKWDVVGQLTALVDTSGSIGSSPSYGNAFAKGGSVTWGMAPSITGQKLQTFKYFFRVALDDVYPGDCSDSAGNDVALRGDLGVRDAVRLASAAKAAGSRLEQIADQNGALFSHEVSFIVTKAVGGAGPTWVIEHYSGLGAKFGISRKDVSTLLVAFKKRAEITTKPQTPGRAAVGRLVPIHRMPVTSRSTFDDNVDLLLRLKEPDRRQYE